MQNNDSLAQRINSIKELTAGPPTEATIESLKLYDLGVNTLHCHEYMVRMQVAISN